LAFRPIHRPNGRLPGCLTDTDAPVAVDVLAGIERTDSRERSSIFSATAGVLAVYNSDAVRAAAANPNFDPGRFAASTDTIYITAPEHKQALCAPAIVGLLEQIRHAVYDHARHHTIAGPPMLWALDEIANTAPIHSRLQTELKDRIEQIIEHSQTNEQTNTSDTDRENQVDLVELQLSEPALGQQPAIEPSEQDPQLEPEPAPVERDAYIEQATQQDTDREQTPEQDIDQDPDNDLGFGME
jgi:hypothetical protein